MKISCSISEDFQAFEIILNTTALYRVWKVSTNHMTQFPRKACSRSSIRPVSALFALIVILEKPIQGLGSHLWKVKFGVGLHYALVLRFYNSISGPRVYYRFIITACSPCQGGTCISILEMWKFVFLCP